MQYAHSLAGAEKSRWHGLAEHLEGTAWRAEEFGAVFGRGWGRLAGLWHDAGKYLPAFQARIGAVADAGSSGIVDHACVGALIACRSRAQPLAMAIAGHHGGLRNLQDVRARLAERSGLLEEARRAGLPPVLEREPLPEVPAWLTKAGAEDAKRKVALWTRFVFSALVDADFLDTEAFYGGAERDVGAPELSLLLGHLERRIRKVAEQARGSVVNQVRNRILEDCRSAAELAPGLFTLTAPTGGGKTLSSLLFALRHAVHHGLRRVIVVIPFTSILEQTAAVYRLALGRSAVIEHHSNLDPDRETVRNRLASENWDAPVIVTTSVQFFESLYAAKPSRCRKLHRIARSVVVFDEVQTFPAGLLDPIRDALDNLVHDYSVSALCCTATQPALLAEAREVVQDVAGAFAALRGRCEIELPKSTTPTTWEDIAERLRRKERVLAIVSRRTDAEKLARLAGDDCVHLSARMCAAHRSAVLAQVKARLEAGERCRVVSTQVVEAGVDIDFPDVYRAMAGADSLAQAAGRCNREGAAEAGRLTVFVAPSEPPAGTLRIGKQVAETMLREGRLDLKAPETFREYFDRLYRRLAMDSEGVLAAERGLQFEDAAKKFRMIPESGEVVIAPYGDSKKRVDEVRREGVTRRGLRRLQPYAVNLYRQEIGELRAAGALERLEDGLWCVVPGYEHAYDERFGFGWQGQVAAEPEALIA